MSRKKFNEKEVFINPTDSQLSIVGELCKIEINFSSFAVFFCPRMETNIHSQHLVYQNIYPLSELKRFFRVNGKENGNVYCKRTKPGLWNMVK